MFTKLNLQGTKNTDGYVVQIMGRHELQYKEGNHMMLIEVEQGLIMAIYLDTIKSWLPPFENEEISHEKKEQIIERLKLAFDFLDIKYEFL